jgi:hypothetical protein
MQLLVAVAANVPSSMILVALMMEALRASEMLISQEQHGITSQKMAICIVTSMKNSNLI